MECSLCARTLDGRRKANCASCAKATIYGARFEQATSLLSREKAHTHVEAILRPGNDGVLAALPEDADWDAITAGVKTNSARRASEEREAVEARIQGIVETADRLKHDIQQYKTLIAERKKANERHRERLSVERAQLQKDNARVTEPVNAAVRKARHRLSKIHTRTIEARECLYQETSAISGLKKVRLPDGRSQFMLRGLPIPNLRELNGNGARLKIVTEEQDATSKLLIEPHELISASADNLCRFLGICYHYLSVRPPAEIIQPHNDFPHAAILPIGSSYKPHLPLYPGSKPSDEDATAKPPPPDLSTPRLLQLDRPLPRLLKEEPKAATLFIEGVSLLAYNLAWLYRTQGAGTLNTFEEMCDVGRNLYHLLPARDARDVKTRPPLNRNISTAPATTTRSATDLQDAKPRFGSYSHGTSRNSLADPESEDQLPEWKVSITRFVDQLKSYLRNEAARAEWHIIDDTEWDEEMEHEKAVLVGGMKRSLAMSVMTVKPSDDYDDDMAPRSAAVDPKGKSGWMKVRGRGGEG